MGRPLFGRPGTVPLALAIPIAITRGADGGPSTAPSGRRPVEVLVDGVGAADLGTTIDPPHESGKFGIWHGGRVVGCRRAGRRNGRTDRFTGHARAASQAIGRTSGEALTLLGASGQEFGRDIGLIPRTATRPTRPRRRRSPVARGVPSGPLVGRYLARSSPQVVGWLLVVAGG